MTRDRWDVFAIDGNESFEPPMRMDSRKQERYRVQESRVKGKPKQRKMHVKTNETMKRYSKECEEGGGCGVVAQK